MGRPKPNEYEHESLDAIRFVAGLHVGTASTADVMRQVEEEGFIAGHLPTDITPPSERTGQHTRHVAPVDPNNCEF